MKNKREESESVTEAQFELKYCERCGGLWLRPMGGGQIYCVRCSREMAKLPPSYQAENGIERETDWDADEEDIYRWVGAELDPDATEGVA
jgi:Zn-finger nucleic acid-binding protein